MNTLLSSNILWRRIFILGCLIGTTAHGYVVAFGRSQHVRDFDLHRQLGERFLTGAGLYDNGYLYPYMPSGAMYFAPLALLDRNTGLFLRYSVAVCALLVSLALLKRMVDPQFYTKRDGLIPGALTILLTLQFILYDLDDGGPQLILTGMLVAGIYCIWKGYEKTGALWFGLTIALKVSPALFVLFFIWKRMWRVTAYTILAAVFWITLPIGWMGASSWWAYQKVWGETAAGSAIGNTTWVTRDNVQRVRNQALRPAMMRYLMTYPEDHPIRKDDPAYRPLLNLPPNLAQAIGIAATGTLIILFCWRTRRPFQGPGDAEWAKECGGVMIVALLISPMAWIQHLPWLVPGIYVIISTIFQKRSIDPLTAVALGGYVLLTVLLNYEFLGKHNFQVLLSYHPFTIAMLLVLGILLWSRSVTPISEKPVAAS